MTNEEKKMEIWSLLFKCSDYLVSKFIDMNSDKMLDEKIEVLTKLCQGVPIDDIPNYYDILELYPKPKEGEKIWWD